MFLKRDASLNLLLVTVIAVVLLLASSATFYNLKLRHMQNDYDEKMANIEKIEQRLILEEQKLKELTGSKEITAKDREALENNYLDIKNENENLRTKLSSFSSTKTVCKAMGNAKCS